MPRDITRKQVLLECLMWLRMDRDNKRKLMQDVPYPETLEAFRDAETKVDILMDVIHFMDTDKGSRGMALWQRMEMQDPEKCRREAMRFVNEEA